MAGWRDELYRTAPANGEPNRRILSDDGTAREQFGPRDWRTRAAARALVKLYRTWNKPDSTARYARWLSRTSPGKSAKRVSKP